MLGKEKLQQPFTNVLSWILTELQENQDDFISIVCKVKNYFINHLYQK